MYGIIPYEKCIVCFVFLVVFALFTCSAIRIDNLVMMTEVSRKNFPPYPIAANGLTSEEVFDQVLVTPRIRHHHRQPRAHFSEKVQSRRQNNKARKHRGGNNNNNSNCPKLDISYKAFTANIVVVARTEAVSVSQSRKYSVLFKVQEKIKYPFSSIIDDYIRLWFLNDTFSSNFCEYNSNAGTLVKANILQSKEYILFLNTYGVHNYSAFGQPELVRRNKIPPILSRVLNSKFKVRPPRVQPIEKKIVKSKKHRLKLDCISRGLPVPLITWSRNGTLLHPTNHLRITYKKRKSTLTIQTNDWGRYECTAHGVRGQSATTHWDNFDYSVHSEKNDPTVFSCEPYMALNYCYNGGTCHNVVKMKEVFCTCTEAFTGQRCESKLPSQSSMYPSTSPLYACKIGLSTKYNC